MESHDYLFPNENTIDPIYTTPPVAGFWRRFAAWLIDIILLGIAGQIIGWSFSSFWFQIGPYGRIVGLIIILLYFGLMNSSLGNGQTVGKLLLGIAVRNRNNQSISIPRSIIRAAILAFPWILNGWELPLFYLPMATWLIIVIVFGLGITIIYTMIFNRSGKQGIHDLICGTYVVNLKGVPVESFPKTAKIHFLVSGSLVALSLLLTLVLAFLSWYWASEKPLATVYSVYQTLQSDNRFFSVGVNDNTFYEMNGQTTRSLRVQVWYKGTPSNEERVAAMNDIAKTVLDSESNLDQYDRLIIGVTSAFDLGIESANFTSGDAQPPELWRRRVSNQAQQ